MSWIPSKKAVCASTINWSDSNSCLTDSIDVCKRIDSLARRCVLSRNVWIILARICILSYTVGIGVLMLSVGGITTGLRGVWCELTSVVENSTPCSFDALYIERLIKLIFACWWISLKFWFAKSTR